MDLFNFLDVTGLNEICSDVKIVPILAAAKFVIRILQIAVPFALVIWGSLDWFKALIAGDEKEMKMKRKPFISRLVAAIVILVLPWLVELIATQIAGNRADSFWKCYHAVEPGIDFTEWNVDEND